MSITLKKNKKLNLNIPTFTCDDGVAEHLNKYDMLKHLNGVYFSGLIGKPGSGKTSMMISWMNEKGNKKSF